MAGAAQGQALPAAAANDLTASVGPEGPTARRPTPPDPTVLNGFWKGPLAVPGGSLEVIFRLMKLSNGEYFATLDVPMQKVIHMEVQVTQHADSVELFAPAAGSRFTGLRSADGQQLVGTWQQPGFKAPMALAFAAIPAAPVASSTTLSRPYREETVALANAVANLRLGATYTVPAGAGPFPAVVLTADAGPQAQASGGDEYSPLAQLADYLTRRGVAVLRYDERGVGRSTGTAAASAADLVSDVRTGLSFLRARPEIDRTHVGVIGHGEGGNVALLAATQELPPAFVVALAAYGQRGSAVAAQAQATALKEAGATTAVLADAAKREQDLLEVIRHAPDNAQARANVASLLRQNDATLDEAAAQHRAAALTSARYRNFLDFDPTAKLYYVYCPVLLLNGTADRAVGAFANLGPLERGLRLNDNKGVYSKRLPGVNHQFQAAPGEWPIVNGERKPTFSPTAEELIREWIVSQVR
ncbi:alpha/beta hydrolase family protein [Hymenobacter caeli]|uniref:Serine aminopeptidase S33 domain-containing protein n=1 Tax=Hymenobacter caeli TaxID=2735894 RepID=A0ABX2FLF5_9BACT|nr:alpha/beta hydrolase [Hymenobacter caeli]NRT17939.1 hypothetical protein [Hymenobacter caeli]